MAICSIPQTANNTALFIQSLFDGCTDDIVVRILPSPTGRANRFLNVNSALTYEPPKAKHVYIGMFGHRLVRNEKGKRTADVNSCTNTGVVWADFDDTKNPVEVLQRVWRSKLPEPSIIVDSGGGLHCYWLLTERAGHEAVDVVKALAVVLGSDGSVCTTPQVMRLPGSYNVKDEFPEPPLCHIISFSEKRYSLSLFQNVLNVKPTQQNTRQPVVCLPQPAQGVTALLEADMPCIRRMANGVPKGHRNTALGRITKYLQLKDYSKERAWHEVTAWNLCCSPQENLRELRASFDGYWDNENLRLLGCALRNPVYQSILSDYCKGSECERGEAIGAIDFDESVDYNNRLLNRLYTPKNRITGYELIVYGVLLRHSEGLTTGKLMAKLTSPTGRMCMGESAVRRSLKQLRKLGFIQTITGNRRAGREDFHKAKRGGTYDTGFTVVTNGAINGAIDGRVTPEEFRVYVLLLRYAFRKGTCFPSLHTLALELGCEKQTVSGHIKRLEEADYIKRSYGYKQNRYKLFFRLLV